MNFEYLETMVEAVTQLSLFLLIASVIILTIILSNRKVKKHIELFVVTSIVFLFSFGFYAWQEYQNAMLEKSIAANHREYLEIWPLAEKDGKFNNELYIKHYYTPVSDTFNIKLISSTKIIEEHITTSYKRGNEGELIFTNLRGEHIMWIGSAKIDYIYKRKFNELSYEEALKIVKEELVYN